VQHIFSRANLDGTNYLRKCEVSLKLLENGLEVDNRVAAQRLFRDIMKFTVIPVSVKEMREDRITALYTLRKYLLSIPDFTGTAFNYFHLCHRRLWLLSPGFSTSGKHGI